VIGYNGPVTVGLPRDFNGLLKIFVRNGPVEFSDEIYKRISMFTEDSSTYQCFVGDLSLLGDGDWKGDEVDLQATNGKLKVYLVDGVEPEALKGRGGFFSRTWS
jgi:hypothetical protein